MPAATINRVHPVKKPFYLLELRRQNRKNPTPAEAVLWQALRGGKLEGLRFLRQKAFGRYIVDFYCAEAGLVIELDGSVHDTPETRAYDAQRTRELEARGLKVLRFRNEEALSGLSRVLEIVRDRIPVKHV